MKADHRNISEQMMPEISGDEACVFSYLLEVQEEPFTSNRSARCQLINGIKDEKGKRAHSR
jgi:hypothetical protein